MSYEKQIMSKDKYPSIFSPQMATIVFIILQIFFVTRAILNIGEYVRIFVRGPSLFRGGKSFPRAKLEVEGVQGIISAK